MQSETVPLWLTFINKDDEAPDLSFIFKVGDDLRKDILTLQMLRVMDSLWKEVGLDLHLFPYSVVATGVNSGLIEVVPKSRTLADIHKTYGGVAAAVVKSSSLQNWLKTGASNELYEKKVQNFILSCAGYSVATYVLGIGDRHNDNIMVTDTGNIFHIDFSRMMGDVMKFAGVERETTPFVLTPDFVEVMGGVKSDGFAQFIKLCCKAYNVVRKHTKLFISLFSIMLETGIPRLQSGKDLRYLRTALQVGKTNLEAEKHFERLIHQSFDNVRARLNFAVHILANP
uniref:PI3K/PI4K catalytic domain-containing protein n=1 Tax=Paramoeba aestuarina TaxID=180227 RepID=A0A7S4L9J6_9EUKA